MLLRFADKGKLEVEGRVFRSFRRARRDGTILLLFGDPYVSSARPGGFWADPEDLLDRWREHGAAMVEVIDGSFAILLLEPSARRLHLLSDRFGTHHLFLTRSGLEVTVSDRLVELAAAGLACRLDPVAVQSFLLYGMILDDRTVFEGVRKLAPATHYRFEWKDDRIVSSSEPYWMPPAAGDDRAPEKAVEAIVTTFTNTLASSAADQPPLSLPLTSGKDSRAILSALYRQPTLHCYTHGDPADPDVKIAQEIARELGVDHDVYALDDHWVGNILENSRRHATSLNGSIDHVRFLHVLSSYDREEHRGGRFYPGAWGNEILEGKFLRPELLGEHDQHRAATAVLTIIEHARGADYSLLADQEATVKAPFLEHLEAIIGRDSRWQQHPTATSLRLVQHTYSPHFFSAFSSYLSKRFSVFHSFLQREVVELMVRVPVEMQRRATLQHAVIARNLPEAVRFPLFSEGNYRFVTATTFNRVKDRLHRSGMPRKVDSALARLFGRGLSPRQYFVDYQRWLTERHRAEIGDLLRPQKLRCRELLSRDAIGRLLAALENGTLRNVHPLTRLMSLELFLRAAEAEPKPARHE